MKTNNNLVTSSKRLIITGVLPLFFFLLINCSSKSVDPTPTPTPPVPPPVVNNEMDFWLTKSDETVKLQKQSTVLAFGTPVNQYLNIDVDENSSFQSVDGFGYTLTGGSAEVINSLIASKKQELLQELFGSSASSIGVSYLRISIGASDLNASPFTYDDMPAGQTDVALANFSLAPDMTNVIPLLKEILAINPNIKILGSPWSPPVWMKDNNSFTGGSLQTKYYAAYAQYFVKYIQLMKAQGITIDAITPQNEPLHPGNNPSMLMLAPQQADFIKNNLGPAFQAANITTKIIIYDHNCDKPEYPISILDDAAAKTFINGSAFHLYAGDISALSTVRNAHPDKALYFTEQWTSSTGNFGGDLKWHLKNVVIGSMRNWSRNALEWNLANNSAFGPHTAGGCDACKGAITIDNNSNFTRNVGYYIIAHAAKFVPQGSIRISSTTAGNLNNVAFKTPEGKKVLIVENDGSSSQLFNIKYNGRWIAISLEAGSVGTFTW
ncbi:MAG: glucosylceramidase [Sediminibacterium sp.]|nr:glucosylceramidase [Sediminibacterium sp.]